jgi:hypothetical protein
VWASLQEATILDENDKENDGAGEQLSDLIFGVRNSKLTGIVRTPAIGFTIYKHGEQAMHKGEKT